ncbi:MAG: NAD(P) transhydrogenase subunit alpha part 2 [Micavibrio sp.]|nr:NAD(P) transhydrogenase subunit alpha part 2 [Micavibrio sp.]|tara:strand:+ start:746374 stop:746796 length:423 start_codon:yes stop_codon:yes gene_type:complete
MSDAYYYSEDSTTIQGVDLPVTEIGTSSEIDTLADSATSLAHSAPDNFFITGLTVFILACFVGYYVVWRVTPALHSPLMGITNAISSVIIVGAIIAVGPIEGSGFSKFLGFLAVILASVNIFGGFIITRRMLHMFKKKGA